MQTHPVLRGVHDVWAQIGAYNAHPMAGSQVLVMAQPLDGMEPNSPSDPSKPPMAGAWVREYESQSGKKGRVFASTYGSSGDLVMKAFAACW